MPRAKKANKATPSQQSRATRIRGRISAIANGDRAVIVTREERTWLADYEEKHPYTRRGSGAAVRRTTSTSSSSEPSSGVIERVEEPASRSSSTSSSSEPSSPPPSESKFTPVDDDAPAKLSELQSKPELEQTCSFGKDCPHCHNGVAKKEHVLGKCGTTGRVVYAPMSEQGGRFFGGAILNGMALAARILRPDHALIEPDDEDYEDMTRAVRMTIDRRLPQLSAWDDLAQLGFAFSAFGRRALFDPPPMQAKKIGAGS